MCRPRSFSAHRHCAQTPEVCAAGAPSVWHERFARPLPHMSDAHIERPNMHRYRFCVTVIPSVNHRRSHGELCLSWQPLKAGIGRSEVASHHLQSKVRPSNVFRTRATSRSFRPMRCSRISTDTVGKSLDRHLRPPPHLRLLAWCERPLTIHGSPQRSVRDLGRFPSSKYAPGRTLRCCLCAVRPISNLTRSEHLPPAAGHVCKLRSGAGAERR